MTFTNEKRERHISHEPTCKILYITHSEERAMAFTNEKRDVSLEPTCKTTLHPIRREGNGVYK